MTNNRYINVGVGQQRRPDPNEATSLYVVFSGGNVKIGIASEVRARMGNMQKSSPLPLELICEHQFSTRAMARAAEASVHERFAEDRLWGEWFAIDYAAAARVVSEVVSSMAEPPIVLSAFKGPAFPIREGDPLPTAHRRKEYNPWSAWESLDEAERERRIRKACRAMITP